MINTNKKVLFIFIPLYLNLRLSRACLCVRGETMHTQKRDISLFGMECLD